jgi:hypothetical protein
MKVCIKYLINLEQYLELIIFYQIYN